MGVKSKLSFSLYLHSHHRSVFAAPCSIKHLAKRRLCTLRSNSSEKAYAPEINPHNRNTLAIKSMRGSDPDAAVYWLARMLEAGEDPVARVRLKITPSTGNITVTVDAEDQLSGYVPSSDGAWIDLTPGEKHTLKVKQDGFKDTATLTATTKLLCSYCTLGS